MSLEQISTQLENPLTSLWSIGLGFTKTMRFGDTPVKFRLEGHYNIVKPDDFGDEWRILFRFSPVIPSPFSRSQSPPSNDPQKPVDKS